MTIWYVYYDLSIEVSFINWLRYSFIIGFLICIYFWMVILYFCPIVQSTQHSPRFLCNLCYIILKVFALYTSTRHHLDQILCKKPQKNAINSTKHFRKELPNKNGTVFYPKISKKAKNNNILLKKPELPALCILQTKMLIFWF